MELARRVGAVVAGVAAVVVMSGCSGGGDEVSAKPSSSTSSAAPSVSPTVAEPAFPDTPAGRLDRLAEEKDWDTSSTSASAYVEDICVSMDAWKEAGLDPAETLGKRTKGEEAEVLRAGMPTLCPRWSRQALAALGGDYAWSYGDGTWTVKAAPKEPAVGASEGEIAPGTYRTRKPTKDCYWERTGKDGKILDNRFATSAQEISVTIRATDGQFTARGCGTWTKV